MGKIWFEVNTILILEKIRIRGVGYKIRVVKPCIHVSHKNPQVVMGGIFFIQIIQYLRRWFEKVNWDDCRIMKNSQINTLFLII